MQLSIAPTMAWPTGSSAIARRACQYRLGGTGIPRKIWKSDDFRTPDDPHLPYDGYGICERERSKPEENWGTLMKIWPYKMADDRRQTRKNWILPGKFQIGKFHHGKIPPTPTKLTQCKKPIYPCTVVHGQFGKFGPFPNFCLETNQLPVWAHDTDWPQGPFIKFWGKSPQGNVTYEFPKFPNISLWENELWRVTCWRSGVRGSCENFYKGENFSIFWSWV